MRVSQRVLLDAVCDQLVFDSSEHIIDAGITWEAFESLQWMYPGYEC